MAYTKMQDVIDGLVSHNKRVFGINDAAMIMGKPRNYVSKLLSGNSRVGRIERGKYYLKGINQPDMYEIASQIVFPSYISLFAAFQFYSITEQSVVKYSAVTIKRHKPVEIGNNVIEFITIGRERFFGYKKIGNAYVATAEKAIIDALYMNSPPLSYVEEAYSESLRRGIMNEGLFMKFAFRMRSGAVSRKALELLKKNSADAEAMRKVLT
ncbi:MAG: hypothetical protein M1569_00335 [Candidatus Marsarchaeota archaeon]|nr:hypothetical protein [Candidatus Marsarchaeota archaeon]